jgi:hypothetical protein
VKTYPRRPELTDLLEMQRWMSGIGFEELIATIGELPNLSR